jgi:basic membrane lipoprotein Med (substrate-binding protein (PBP1-ABC) superfamily)
MFDAVKNRKNVLVFGTNRNQNNLAPDQCLGSAVIEMPRAFQEVAKSAKDENFQPTMQKLTMQNNTISAHWNPQLKAKIPAALMKRIEAAEKKIKDGQLKVGT